MPRKLNSHLLISDVDTIHVKHALKKRERGRGDLVRFESPPATSHDATVFRAKTQV